MKATDLLEKEHRKIEALLASRLPADAAAAREFLARLEAQIDLHFEVEEALFYPAAREAGLATEAARSRHQETKDLLAELTRMAPAEAPFAPTLARLRRLLEAHVGETEQDLFPKAEQRLAPERLEALARHLREYKRSLTRVLLRRRPA
jgi:hypothetical protein